MSENTKDKTRALAPEFALPQPEDVAGDDWMDIEQALADALSEDWSDPSRLEELEARAEAKQERDSRRRLAQLRRPAGAHFVLHNPDDSPHPQD